MAVMMQNTPGMFRIIINSKPTYRPISESCTGYFFRYVAYFYRFYVLYAMYHPLLCLAEASRLGYPFQYMCADDELHPYLFLFIHIKGKPFHIALYPLILERISQVASTGLEVKKCPHRSLNHNSILTRS
jgi:hypothetical protein